VAEQLAASQEGLSSMQLVSSSTYIALNKLMINKLQKKKKKNMDGKCCGLN
jgi:hypothetical protein